MPIIPEFWNAEAEGLCIEGQPALYSQFKVTLDYIVRKCQIERERER